MHPTQPGSLTALRASTAGTAHGLARWLVLVLLVFDQFSAPWHTHHHDSGVDGAVVGAVVGAVHAHGHPSAVLARSRAEAPDHRATVAHATTALRSEVNATLARVGDKDEGQVLWPVARLAPAIKEPTHLAVASHHEPPTPAYRSLRPSPQAPPWRA